MQFTQGASDPEPSVAAAAEAGPVAHTRDRVAREVLAHGPVCAADIAAALGLTPAAVRRHLDALEETGLVRTHEAVSTGQRGRGRPARSYVATDAGHGSMATAYDDLAASAMGYLAERLGDEAVEAFAARRVADLEQRYAPVVDAAGPDVADRTAALAEALAKDGFAATSRPVTGPGGDVGAQLCQGHCPVQNVAEKFPQLCDAETEVFSRLLGVHVQRLATLASGAHVCTTHVPNRIPARAVAAGRTSQARMPNHSTKHATTQSTAHREGRTTR